MADIAAIVYAQLKERPEFAWIGVLEAVNKEFEDALNVQITSQQALTNALQQAQDSLESIRQQLSRMEATGAAMLETAEPIAVGNALLVPEALPTIEILRQRKQGTRVITSPTPANGSYQAVLETFLASGEKKVVVDMSGDKRSPTTVYQGLHRRGQEDVLVYMKNSDVFLERGNEAPDPQQAAPASRVVLDRTQLERLPEEKRARANGKICQLPGCGMPLVDTQNKYCCNLHFTEHRSRMLRDGVVSETVEPLCGLPGEGLTRGITVLCGETIRPSRQSDGGPGSDRELAAINN